MAKEIKLTNNTKKYAKKKVVFKRDMTIGDALKVTEGVQDVLSGFGMHCFTCPFSLMETLEQAAMTHGVDVDLMMSKLNELSK